MACEISVERAISRAFKAKGIDYLEQPIEDLLPSYNLAWIPMEDEKPNGFSVLHG
jgi:hypothetical protein